MTVQELMAALHALQCPDARVVVEGFDGQGLEDLAPPTCIWVRFHDAAPVPATVFDAGRHADVTWEQARGGLHAVPEAVQAVKLGYGVLGRGENVP